MATTRRRRRIRVGLLALALVIAGCGDGGSGVDGARDVVADDGRFDTPAEAAESFARVAELLLEEGRRCTVSCDGILGAAAWVQFVAVDVLRCRQPGVHDTRVAVLDHLEAVQLAIDDEAPAPGVPPLPTC